MSTAHPHHAPAPPPYPALPRRKLKVATCSLAGCFGCHMSFLDIDERILQLIEHVEFDRSPLTDLKEVGRCDLGLIEGGLCNAENVEVLRDFRRQCHTLVAVGACAITGGLPAQRNAMSLPHILGEVYQQREGLKTGCTIPNDPELPLLLRQVRPLHEVVQIDYFLPGCPPSADSFWVFLTDLIAGHTPRLASGPIRYD